MIAVIVNDLPEEYLDGLLDTLAAAAAGRRPGHPDRERCRQLAGRAAGAGIGLATVATGYLAAAARVWPTLPKVADPATTGEVRTAGRAVLAALAALLDALADGYAQAHLLLTQREDQVRHEFVDDLLDGRGDPGRLAERAERFGVLLAGRHVVIVVRTTDAFTAGDPVATRVEAALGHRFGARNVLVTVRDRLLVCITSSGLRGAPGELAHHLLAALGADAAWRIGVGRPHSGPGGVLRSYEEARNALDLADRLGFRAPVLHAADLLVFPVLLRDRGAINDLVGTVLGPLAEARGGPEPLLDTLTALFACQGNTAATARHLGLSVRAVTYRLERIQRLTGYSPTEPTQRFTLEAAVLGAKLLDWPRRHLDP